MMLCEKHCRQISCIEETFQRVVKELKQENLALKNENSKFREFLQTVLSNLTYVILSSLGYRKICRCRKR
jgi:FtsZ-binding cell division protein ZapB